MGYVAVIVVAAAIFTAVILYLAVNQDNREKWLGITFLIASTGGFCLYGAANAYGSGSFFADVFETIVDVGRMFAGINDVAAFQKFAGEDSPWMVLFWAIHFLAYYSMASAIIMAVAKGTLKRLRSWFLKVNDVELIYGITGNSIAYGRNLAENKHASVVFVGTSSAGKESDISKMGGLLYTDNVALNPDRKLLERLSVKKGKGKIRLSALSRNIDANYEYAQKLLKCLKDADIDPQQTEVVLYGHEEHNGEPLQAHGEKYGYGTVRVFDKAELVARLLIQKYPLCDAISFDEKGRATEDTDVLLVGFGRKGQEILEKIVENGQFEGSSFRIKVFDSNGKNTDGFFRMRHESLLENYDITFEPYDGRSRQFAEYLSNELKALKYIVVAVGDSGVGREIAMNILELMSGSKIDIPVYQCNNDSVVRYQSGQVTECSGLYDADIMYGGHMDDFAKMLNHQYCHNDASAKKNWADCRYFDRMSSRASADYLSSLLKRIGVDKMDIIPEEMLLNLAKSEHLRWNAFHHACGYRKMEKDELKKRAELYANGGISRITKGTENKLHACLVSWDELDELSKLESSITGKDIDYKKKDMENVLMVKELLNR